MAKRRALRKILLLQIILAILLFVLAVVYILKGRYSAPNTEVYLTNTSVIGRILGLG